MSEQSLEEKQKYLDELGKFVNDAENYMKDVCSSVGWDYDALYNYEETEKYALCPFNNGHKVPERTMHKHLIKCEWKALGYTEECKPLPEPVLSPDDPSTIKFDISLQAKVLREAKEKNPELNISLDEKFIPQTSDRLTSDFSSDEKKAMYEYVIANTVGPDIGYDITEMNKPEKSNDNEAKSTPIEMLLAQERNLKRRRARHRGVHTNKKSHTEIMRELVQQQMEMYREHLSEKYGIPIPSDDESIRPNVYDEDQHKNLGDYVEQSLYSMQNQKNWSDDDQSDYKHKYNSKVSDRKSEREKFYDREHSSSHRYSNHQRDYDYKSTSKYDFGSSSKRQHQYYPSDKNRDVYDSHEKSRDKYDSHNRNRDKYDSRQKYECQDSKKVKNKSRDSSKERKESHYDKNMSQHKSKNYYNSQNTSKDKYNKYDLDQNEYSSRNKNNDRDESLDKKESKSTVYTSCSRKRERSKSKEQHFVEEKRNSQEGSSHKRHKKERKHEKNKSRDKDDKKHKKSKRKRDRDRSRS